MKFYGKEGEDFITWKSTILGYLEEWCVDKYIVDDYDDTWSELKKYNSKCVFAYFMTCCEDKACTTVTAVAVDRKPKLAWAALEKRYAVREDTDVSKLMNIWYRSTSKQYKNATEFILAIEEINDFRAYLATPKFTDESAGILRHYINIGEVEYRLMELRHLLEDATL